MRLYCGGYNKQGYYNSQPIGLSRALKKRGMTVTTLFRILKLAKLGKKKLKIIL